MRITILGSSAGGGFPQWNCNCRNCDGARKGSVRAKPRTQSSIFVQGEGQTDGLLFNASPDILQQVRANPDMAKTPFIMVTAESKTENVIAAKKAGVSNYIVKPFNAATLKAKIDAVFGD